jgi:hypothetical protein
MLNPSRIVTRRSLAATLAATAAVLLAAPAAHAADRADLQSTQLISRSLDGGVPNGPSTNAVISNDRRWARVIAFESEASDLVPGDVNGVKDVFAVLRGGTMTNFGPPWHARKTILVSRTRTGEPANGPSFGAAVGGGYKHRPRCVAFLSTASNLVPGDTNGTVDAFVLGLRRLRVTRLTLPRRVQTVADVTAVAASGDCKRFAFVSDGRMYVRITKKVRKKRGKKRGRKAARRTVTRTRMLRVTGVAADPSFSTGLRNDLVFGADAGVYLSKRARGRPRLIAPGGRNPAYNDIKRRVVAYEVNRDGRWQIGYHDLGRPEKLISHRRGTAGNGDSRDPVIGNSGYYVTFESDAANLGVNALSRAGDFNGRTDTYLYTNVRDITLVQSVEEKAEPLPGGGQNPSMSFYANYILFDSPAPLGSLTGAHQVYMRYLGPV